jgi:hypothetical protein
MFEYSSFLKIEEVNSSTEITFDKTSMKAARTDLGSFSSCGQISIYSARRLIGSGIIESAAYCNQKLLAICTLTVHKTRRLIESFGYCYHFYGGLK